MMPEQKIAKSVSDLYDELIACHRMTMPDIMHIVIAATPEFTKHYLKGQ